MRIGIALRPELPIWESAFKTFVVFRKEKGRMETALSLLRDAGHEAEGAFDLPALEAILWVHPIRAGGHRTHRTDRWACLERDEGDGRINVFRYDDPLNHRAAAPTPGWPRCNGRRKRSHPRCGSPRARRWPRRGRPPRCFPTSCRSRARTASKARNAETPDACSARSPSKALPQDAKTRRARFQRKARRPRTASRPKPRPWGTFRIAGARCRRRIRIRNGRHRRKESPHEASPDRPRAP